MRKRITVGIDESGTGSWAGDATCCAFAAYDSEEPWLLEAGARDSKALSSHEKRAAVREALGPCAVFAKVERISSEALSTDHKKAWREGMAKAAAYVLSHLGSEVRVVIDGNEDRALTEYFIRVWDLEPIYKPKADILVPAVSAASIFAKTARTEHVRELAAQYPGYGWEVNDGYGTPDHQAAIAQLGVVAGVHRRIKPLLKYFQGDP